MSKLKTFIIRAVQTTLPTCVIRAGFENNCSYLGAKDETAPHRAYAVAFTDDEDEDIVIDSTYVDGRLASLEESDGDFFAEDGDQEYEIDLVCRLIDKVAATAFTRGYKRYILIDDSFGTWKCSDEEFDTPVPLTPSRSTMAERYAALVATANTDDCGIVEEMIEAHAIPDWDSHKNAYHLFDDGSRYAWETGDTWSAAEWEAETAYEDECDTPVPPKTTLKSDEEIVQWIAEKRKLYAAGELPNHQIRRIDQIPGWSWTEEAFHA